MAWVRGQQRKDKYPNTGPRYDRWGEQTHAGLAYDPATDTYHAMSPEEQKALEDEINPKPKQPGIYEMAGANTIPAAASTLGLIAASRYLGGSGGEKVVEEGVKEVIKEQAAETAAEAAAESAAQEGIFSATAPEAAAESYSSLAPEALSPTAMGGTPFYVPLAIAIQTALSGKTALDMLKGETPSWDPKDDPINAIGRGGLAIATGGLSEIGNALLNGMPGHKSTKEIEADRWKGLLGLNIPGAQAYYDQLGKEPKEGDWKNEAFAASRNEADLKPEDIWGSQDVIRAGGQDYFTGRSEEERRRFSQELLNRGLIQEKKGGIYATDDAAAADLYKELFGEKKKEE